MEDCNMLVETLSFHQRFWLWEIIVGLIVLVVLNFLFKKGVEKARLRSISRASRWQDGLDYILHTPFQVLLWILGTTLVIQILGKRFDFSFFGSYIDAFRSTGFIVCLTWVLLRWKNVFQKQLLSQDLQKKKIDVGFALVISKVISIIAILICMMIILEIWGLNIAPLLAFGGIGAAAIGFAAKDVLANFFGGVMLYVNRPFAIGDFIHLPKEQVEGYVEDIGWNTTTIRDKDKRPLYLPNATFSQTLVINGSRMTHRRIVETIGIRYQDFPKMQEFVIRVQKRLEEHSDIDRYLPVLVVLNSLSGTGLSIFIDVYTLKTRYNQFLECKHEILSLVYKEMRDMQIEFSSPMLTLSGSIQDR